MLASVPDLISVLDSQTATAISTEMLRYGQRRHGPRLAVRPALAHPARSGDRRAARIRIRPRLHPHRGAGPCRLTYVPIAPSGATCGSASTSVAPTPTRSSSDASNEILAWTKKPTTVDVTGGMRAALGEVLARDRLRPVPDRPGHARHDPCHQRHPRASRPRPRRGDPHRRPGDDGDPPAGRLARDLAKVVAADSVIVRGGHLRDGYPIAPLDTRRACGASSSRSATMSTRSRSRGSSAPRSPTRERTVAELVRSVLGATARCR